MLQQILLSEHNLNYISKSKHSFCNTRGIAPNVVTFCWDLLGKKY